MDETETDRVTILGAAAKQFTAILEEYPLFKNVQMIVITVVPDGSELGDIMNIVTSVPSEEVPQVLEHATRYTMLKQSKTLARGH